MKTGLRGAVLEHLAAIGCGVLAAVALAVVCMPHGWADEPVYKERVIEPLPDIGELPSSVYDPKADCGCTAGAGGTGYDLWLPRNKAGDSPYYASLIGGASYFDAPDKASGGGLLGAQVGVPIADRTGVFANGAVNVYSGGSQYSIGLGGYRNSTYYGSFSDRLGGSFTIYQFTDTRFNSPYLVSGRYSLNYAILPGVRAGVRYYDPIHGGTATLPGGGTIGGGQIMFESVEGTLNIGSVRRHLNLAAGYSDHIQSGVFQLGIARPVSQRVSLALDTYYAENVGYWWGFLGFQIDLSPRDQPQFGSLPRHRDIVRGGLISAMSVAESAIESEASSSGEPFAEIPTLMGDVDPKQPFVHILTDLVGPGGGGCQNCPQGFVPSGNGCVELTNPSNFIPCP